MHERATGDGPATGSGTEARSRPGRPRSERARLAILQATVELLEQRGLRAVSMDDIAGRAGVSKATIYRWWDSKGVLALDAFEAELAAAQPVPDTGSLAGDLVRRVRSTVGLLTTTPAGRTVALLVGEAQHDPGLREAYRVHVLEPLRRDGMVILERARARGELRPGTDLEATWDLVYGAVYHRFFHGHAPLNEHFARTIVDIVLHGVTASE